MNDKRKLKNDVVNAHQEFVTAVHANKIKEWLNNCVDYYLIYDKNHIYVGAEVIVTSNDPSITLYTRNGQFVGSCHDEQYVNSIGSDYTHELDKFIENNYAI